MSEKSPLPRSAAFMTPSYDGGRCLVCKRLIGAEPARIVRYPDAVHSRCVDRYYQNFPFDDDLNKLRRLAKGLITAYRLVVEEGKWLARAARHWPAERDAVLSAWPERKGRARAALAALLGSWRGL